MDIRWEQRFSNFTKAMKKFEESVKYLNENKIDDNHQENIDVISEMLKEGLIQRFEYTHELAWNVMKDYAEYQGNANLGGSRDAIREAFRLQLIENGTLWMDMIASRNKTSHLYNEETADEIFTKILKDYYPLFVLFKNKMEEKRSGIQNNLF